MMKHNKLNQAGDTIVEVLLAVVVVGLAIALGYGVASRSLKANRQAQERTEALKQVESQVERLKKRAVTDKAGVGIFKSEFQSEAFCLADLASGVNEPVGMDRPADEVAQDPLGSAYPDECVDGLYHMSIRPSSAGTTTQFDVTARWFSLGDTEKEESTVTYRIAPAR